MASLLMFTLLALTAALGIYPFLTFNMPRPWSRTSRKHLKALIPGILLGLCVAALYVWYSFIRPDNPFEFWHIFLPEFSAHGGQQFALRHILPNMPIFIFGLPFEGLKGPLTMTYSGFSLFLANPMVRDTLLTLFPTQPFMWR